MKITKSELMRILQEEIATLTQEENGMTATDARRAAIDQARELGSGITDEERAAITAGTQALIAAARKTDITSGAAGHRFQALLDVLQAAAGGAGEQGPEGQ